MGTDRRTFLKGAAGVAAAVGVGTLLPVIDPPGVKDARDYEKSWLLIKETDETKRPGYDVTEALPLSVATGRDMETIARERDAVWESTVVEKPARGGRWQPKTSARKAKPASPSAS